MNTRHTDDAVLEPLAAFVRELGRFPVVSELQLKKRSAPSFPNYKTLQRWGNRRAVAAKLQKFCAERGEHDVAEICAAFTANGSKPEPANGSTPPEPDFGSVYLLRSGRFYKIGRTNAVGRRERELAIQLPERATVVHSIRTDDPSGIEDYWHRRFAARRRNGEWFELNADDLAAFRRRKFM